MNTYRFLFRMRRVNIQGWFFILLATILICPPVIPAQAASAPAEAEWPLHSQAAPAPITTPAPERALEDTVNCDLMHEYSPGETLTQIATSYHITVDQLKEANPWLTAQAPQAEILLCIPAVKVNIDRSYAELHAYLIFGHLTVYGWGFPKNYRYTVRVIADRSDVWYKTGHLRAAKDSSIQSHFKLPKEIRYPRRMKVCLKELDTGWLICTRVEVYRL